MNIGEGFRNIFQAAWNLMDTVIFPAGVVGNDNPITLMNIFILGLGSIFTIKFVRYCMGGHFNIQADKSSNIKRDVNVFMHEDSDQLDSLLDAVKKNGGRWQ